MPVRVDDGRGRFVPGLTLEDFEVAEDGVVQPIERMVEVRGAGRPPSADATSVPDAPQGAVVVAFDDAHVDPGAFTRLKTAAVAFLRGLPPSDLAGAFVNGRLVDGRLSADKAALEAAISAAQPSPTPMQWRRDAADWPRITNQGEAALIAADNGPALDQAVRRACADDPDACRRDGGDSARMELMARGRRLTAELRQSGAGTLANWRALARGLRAAPGRKSLVVLTGGFDAREQMAAMQSVIEEAARADVVVYVVDAEGTARAFRGVDPLTATGWVPGDTPLLTSTASAAEDVMQAIADGTGGYVVRGRNDLAAALAGIADDRASYYVLGYAPPDAAREAWRRLRVTVRRPGLRVRARQGYWAAPAAAARTTAAPATVRSARETDAVGLDPAPFEAPAAAAAPRPGPESATPAVAAAREDAGAAPSPGAASGAAPGVAAVVPVRPTTLARVEALAGGAADAGGESARAGWAAYQRGDVETARGHLMAAARDPGQRPWVFYALGFAEAALARPEEAAAAWERVRRAVPEFQPVYFDLADAYLQAGRSAEAMRVLEAADGRWPGDAGVLNALGSVQVGRGSIEAGLACFLRALAADDRDPMTHFNLGKTYELRYVRSARFVRSTRQWYRDRAARDRAAAHYQRHIDLGGTLSAQAREGLERLAFAPR